MRDSVVSRLKNITQDAPKPTDGGIAPKDQETPEAFVARVQYLQQQSLELMNQARFLHARILLAIQANELDPQLRKVLFDGFLNMAALVEVKE